MQEMQEKAAPVSAAELNAWSVSLGEPVWLADARVEALDHFIAAPWPDRAQHLWRYSDPAQFEAESVGLGVASAPVLTLGETARAAGLTLLSLSEAAAHAEHGSRVREHLGRLIGKDFGRIEALNAAAWSRGVYLHVPRKAVVDEPVHLRFEAGAAGHAARRILAIVEEGAEITLIEEHVGGDDATGVVHAVTEIVAGQASRVHFVFMQHLVETVRAHFTQRIRLGRDARALTALTSFGGKNTKVDVGTLMAETGSACETIGMLYGRGRQLFDHHTVHHHTAPHTQSQLDFKVVLDGRARSAYTGNIGIEKSAPYSEAFQLNRNLLLSDKARAESIPELEIDIDEVQCSHGATVGPVSADELFYLMSRGIPEKEAIRQIVSGFMEAILQRVPENLIEPMRAELQTRLKEL